MNILKLIFMWFLAHFLMMLYLLVRTFYCGVELRIKDGKIRVLRIIEEDHVHVSSQNHKEQLQNMISEFKPQKTKDVEKIKLQIAVKDEIPIYQRARRLAVQELETVNTQIKECKKEDYGNVNDDEERKEEETADDDADNMY